MYGRNMSAARFRRLVFTTAAVGLLVPTLFTLGGLTSAEEAVYRVIGLAFLDGPYVTLARLADGRGIVRFVVLLGLIASTLFGFWAAASDANGALIFIWLLPAQVLVVVLALRPWRAPPRARL